MTMQPLPAAPVDAAAWAEAYLMGALAGRTEEAAAAEVSARGLPERRPDFFVTIRRDGGATDTLLDRPRLAVTTYALTYGGARALASLVTGLLLRAPLADPTHTCVWVRHLSGPNDLDPNPAADAYPRAYSLFEATLRCGYLNISEET